MSQFLPPPLRAERFHNPASAQVRAAVAVSACLLGEPVRYDGKDKYCTAVAWLGEALQLLPVCPEVGAGLGVPRPPVRLVQSGDGALRALGRDDPMLDVTDALRKYAEQSLRELSQHSMLCGYLWKSRSPSCGFGSTPVFDAAGHEIGTSSGIQATAIRTRLPWLAFCEESELVEEAPALRFLVQCRLAFDVLQARAALAELHAHYSEFIRACSVDDQLHLAAAAAGTRAEYLVALHAACRRLPVEQLLELFTVR